VSPTSQQAHYHGQKQAGDASAIALSRGQFFGKNGDKDQVVDAEHQFQ